MSKKRGPHSIQSRAPKLVELPTTQVFTPSETTGMATTQTFAAEPLPATPDCANCAELRRLLAGMRVRVDEVDVEYGKLLAERNALLARLDQRAPTPQIEIINDLPISNHG